MANRSKFPEQIDTFPELYDLPPNMVIQAKRYQELKTKPVLTSTEQNELNGLTTQLTNFIITPEVWNKFSDAIVNIETFFNQQVAGYIEAKQVQWNTYVKNFKSAGTYSASLAYKNTNMVKSSTGDLYLALKDVPKGTPLTDVAHWQKISTKGDKGDIGLNSYYKGEFSNTQTYATGDAVTYKGFLYYCKKDAVTNVLPTADGASWFLWDRTIISEAAPLTRQEGLLWLKIQ